MDIVSYIQPAEGFSAGNRQVASRSALFGKGGHGEMLDGAGPAGGDARLKKACSDFESIFVYAMLKSMRRSLPENGLFDNSEGQKMYKAMADQAMAENIARQGGVGLGRLLYEQLVREDAVPPRIEVSPVAAGGAAKVYSGYGHRPIRSVHGEKGPARAGE